MWLFFVTQQMFIFFSSMFNSIKQVQDWFVILIEESEALDFKSKCEKIDDLASRVIRPRPIQIETRNTIEEPYP